MKLMRMVTESLGLSCLQGKRCEIICFFISRMEAVPLDGPHVDLTGTASVEAAAHGTHVAYKVQSVPVEGPVSKVVAENSDTVFLA